MCPTPAPSASCGEELASYGEEFADIMDLLYSGRGKDYDAEAAEVVRQVRSRFPGASSLLDVGCGTGSHLQRFRDAFDHVEGVEPAPAMRRRAEKKLRSVRVHAGDLREFRLDRAFDAVTCMYGPIAYMQDETQLCAAIRRMAAHLVPGGVLVLDPWWFLENFIEGYVRAEVAHDEARSLARVSHSVRTGSSMCITAKYLVGDTAGITEFSTQDTLSLFRQDQYADAFTRVGLTVEYLPAAASDRGLFVGTRRR